MELALLCLDWEGPLENYLAWVEVALWWLGSVWASGPSHFSPGRVRIFRFMLSSHITMSAMVDVLASVTSAVAIGRQLTVSVSRVTVELVLWGELGSMCYYFGPDQTQSTPRKDLPWRHGVELWKVEGGVAS